LTLTGPPGGEFAVPGSIPLQGILVVGDPAGDAPAREGWLRSLFVLAISRSNQVPYVANLVGERLVFAGDMEPRRLQDGAAVSVASFRFDLNEALGGALRREDYYVQVSARQHRSNVLLLRCRGAA
jgi:hypothetical protein